MYSIGNTALVPHAWTLLRSGIRSDFFRLHACECDIYSWCSIIEFWSSVRDAMFAGEMDTFLPHPIIKEEMYFFAGIMTVKIDTASSLCFSTMAPVLQC